MDGLWQDIRFAGRTWRRAPGFALVVLATLTLGIGANTAIFSVVNGILLRPLPYEDPERLVAVAPRAESGVLGLASPPDLRDWRTRTSSFVGVAGQTSWGPTLTGSGTAQALSGGNVSYDMFEVLGVAPAIGRSFRPEEDQPGAQRVVVLSDVLWRQIFQADSAAIGKTLRLDDATYTVIGVMPPGFRTPAFPDARLWSTLSLGSEYSRGSRFVQAVGRLRAGVSLPTAVAEMVTLGRQIAGEDPDYASGWSIAVMPLHEHLVGDVSGRLYVLLGAVGLVLFIAVANVANLFLARATGRHAELAVRAALGAGRGRILRQLVSESLLLGLVGGLLGLALAIWGTHVLLGLAPPDEIPRLDAITADMRVLIFTIVLSVIAGVVFGLFPALTSSRVTVAGSMRSSGRGASDTRARRRMRQGLVVAQVALAFILLVGSGLLIRSFARLLDQDPGFDRGVLTAGFSLGASYDGIEAYDRFFTSLLDRLQARPGVEGVGAVMAAPFAGRTFSGSFGIEGRTDDESPSARLLGTSPDFFSTLGIPVLRGRAFSESDGPGAPPVAIINRTAADRYWQNQDPIGQRINVHIRFAGIPRQPPREIVGVVGDAQFETLRAGADPQIYLPYRQYPTSFMNVFVRTAGHPERFEPALREEVRALDPNVAVSDVATLGEMVGASVAGDRFYTALLTVFATVALGLAAVGVYAVLAYAVSQRRNEIGIRMALGARGRDVTTLVISEGVVLGGIGLSLGVAGAVVLHRVIAGFLFDIHSRDPLTYGTAMLVILSMTLLASYVPARRARRVDPIVALRAGA
jgi:predicted permease